MSVVDARSSPMSAMGQDQSGDRTASLGDILERVLDKGLVIAGDIQVNLLDIELLTIKLRLVIASLETAKAVGIDWWERDPWLRGGQPDLEGENRELRARIAELEQGRGQRSEGVGRRTDGQDDDRKQDDDENQREAQRASRGAR